MIVAEKALSTRTETWPPRLYALDVSRGLASLSVVLWHWQHFAYRGTSLATGFVRDNQPLYGIFKIFYERGLVGVEYFFLLSGFIFFWLYREPIHSKTISAWTFCVQRFSRLYPLHIVTLIAAAILQVLYLSREKVPFIYPYNDAYHFLLNVVFATAWGLERGLSFNAPTWSVSVEVLLYVLFFLLAFSRRSGLLLSLSIALSAHAVYFRHHQVFFLGLGLFFLGGVVFYVTTYISKRKTALRTPVYALAILTWTMVLVRYYIPEVIGVANFGPAAKLLSKVFSSYLLFPLTICGLALWEIDKGALFKPVSWIGDITYSSYLLHFPLQVCFGLAVSTHLLDPEFYRDVRYLILYFIILIPLSHLVYRKFERPVQSYLRDRLTGQRRG